MISTNIEVDSVIGQPHIVKKVMMLSYGVLSYGIGVAGLGAIILLLAGMIPAGLFQVTSNTIAAVVINIGLVCLFGLQHSIMARPSFKRFFARLFGEASERSTFVWSSGVVSLILVGGWQTVDGVIWSASSAFSQTVMWVGFGAGWTYLLAATFAINHWDLFGLRQVWLAVKGDAYSEPSFKENWMYRYSRHPIMVGALIGMWVIPEMTASKFVLSASFTLYIFVGLWFEERDLIRNLGQTYIDYKRRVGMFITLP